MKVVAVVPMKMNNSRLPGKNTMCFTGGEPLCSYILRTLKAVEEIDEVYVYCSDEGVRDYLPDGVAYLQRNTDLDTDSTKMNEILMRFASDVEADVYVLSHATGPFVTTESIGEGLQAILTGVADSAFAVRRIQGFIWQEGQPNYSLEAIPRTQDIAPIFEETSGFYAFERDVLVEHGRRIGYNPHMVEVGAIEAIDIDEREDFQIADAVFSFMNEKDKSALNPDGRLMRKEQGGTSMFENAKSPENLGGGCESS